MPWAAGIEPHRRDVESLGSLTPTFVAFPVTAPAWFPESVIYYASELFRSSLALAKNGCILRGTSAVQPVACECAALAAAVGD